MSEMDTMAILAVIFILIGIAIKITIEITKGGKR